MEISFHTCVTSNLHEEHGEDIGRCIAPYTVLKCTLKLDNSSIALLQAHNLLTLSLTINHVCTKVWHFIMHVSKIMYLPFCEGKNVHIRCENSFKVLVTKNQAEI